MDIVTYQIKSRETAVYPLLENPYEYPGLGLIGEFGEICEKVKKIHRDREGKFSEEDLVQLQKELGDFCWYMAQLATEWEITLYRPQGFIAVGPLNQVLFSTSATIGKLLDSRFSVEDKDNLQYLFNSLVNNCRALAYFFGSSLEDIFDLNIEKLQSRKERGVLHGDGDNR